MTDPAREALACARGRNMDPQAYREPRDLPETAGPPKRPRRFGFNPDWVVHPGETLREWRVENHLPSQAAAMACAGMPTFLYERVEAGAEPIDPQIAAALAHGTGISATLWLNLERIFRAGLAAGKTWTP